MLDSESIGTRFTVSALSNIGRAVLAFATGVLLARGLDPTGYGDLTFLLGTFVAIRALFDLGSGNAFYTFLSQRRRHRTFHLYYFAWLLIQFAVVCLLVAIVLPRSVLERIWLGHERGVILLALAAAFAQQQVWQTFVQIGEARRKTVRVQIISTAVALVHLVVVGALLILDALSVVAVFWVLIAEYAIAVLIGGMFLRDRSADAEPEPPRELLGQYWVYCRPLIALSIFGFFYDFADRWMLQRFAGAGQQGLFQIANQFAAISLVATTSLLNIFWKEVAEANARGDTERMARIYQRVNKSLVLFGAMVSGLLIPWADSIIALSLGSAYAAAAPVLMLMLLYPVHQSMGQIGGTMLLATGRTQALTRLTIAVELMSIPVTWFVLAPLPGLALGAAGLAAKMVVLNIASVNAQALIIARQNGWKFEWLYQPIGIGAALLLGYACKVAVGRFDNLAASFIATCALFAVGAAFVVYAMPWLIGMDRPALRRVLAGER